MRFYSQQETVRRRLLTAGSLLISFCLLSPGLLALAQLLVRNFESVEDEVYLLIVFVTLYLGHTLISIGAKGKRLRLLSIASMLLSLLGGFPVYAFWAAPAVEFCTLGILGVLSLLVLGVPLCILSIVTVVLSTREVLSCRMLAGHCAKCSYNLTGLTKPRCPECGTPFDPALLPRLKAHEEGRR